MVADIPCGRTESIAGDIKTVTEVLMSGGKKIQRTTRYRLKTEKISVISSVLSRKEWRNRKFGACRGCPPGPEMNITAVERDEVLLEVIRQKDHDHDAKAAELAESMKTKAAGNRVICRNCGMVGDHWTAKCPQPRKTEEELNQMIGFQLEGTELAPKPASGHHAPAVGSGMSSLAALAERIDSGNYESETKGDSTGKYVAPTRAGAGPRSKEGYTLRISNISEDTQENDLYELCLPFGQVSRVYLVKDRQYQTSRGFAFVSYHAQEDAERAMAHLSGYGYDHLILKVEWAKPSVST